MKRTILLMLVLSSYVVHGQYAPGTIVTNESRDYKVYDIGNKTPGKIDLGSQDNTRGPARWYDIVDAVDQSFGAGINVYGNASYNTLWSDSTILAPYGSGPSYSGVWIKSVANYIDPVDPRYNDPNIYPGASAISNSDAFSVDSLFIPFLYYRNAAKASVVDTLVVSVIYGNGNGNGNDLDARYYGPTSNTASNHSTDTLRVYHGFTELNPASANQFGYIASSPSRVRTMRIPLTAATLNDTVTSGSATGFNYVKIPVNLNVPAGNKVAANMTFKSGDTWIPNVDTVYISGQRETPNFNNLRFVAFEEITGGHQQYTKGIWTQSALMRNDTAGWGNRHIPCFAFNNTSYEHQWFQWKLNCPTCGAVGVEDNFQSVTKINLYPNPTTNTTNLEFETVNALHNTKVEVVGLTGKILSTMEYGNINANTNFNRSIDLSGLAAGLYFVKLSSDEGSLVEKIMVK